MSKKYEKIPATYLEPYPLQMGSGAQGLSFRYENGEIHNHIGDARMIEAIINNIEPNQKVIINYAEEWDWYLELATRVNYGIISNIGGFSVYCYHRRAPNRPLKLPRKFIDLLRRVAKSTKRSRLEFSIAYDDEEQVWAIAIVHPRDYFNKRIGRKIVEGRVRRMKGLIPNREVYNPIPEWIYVAVNEK